MFSFSAKKIIFCSQQDMFSLVLDVESYPSFLPWCLDVRIVERAQSCFISRMTVGFPPFRENFDSEVCYNQEKNEILVQNIAKKPFSFLKTRWFFKSLSASQTEVSFEVSFSFSSFLMQKTMGKVFCVAQKKILESFEKEAYRRYGTAEKNSSL